MPNPEHGARPTGTVATSRFVAGSIRAMLSLAFFEINHLRDAHYEAKVSRFDEVGFILDCEMQGVALRSNRIAWSIASALGCIDDEVVVRVTAG
jgi:hypothetical protein